MSSLVVCPLGVLNPECIVITNIEHTLLRTILFCLLVGLTWFLQELERMLAAKQASLPQEPSSDDENAVTLLVRMPNGSRRGRRFLKSDKLQVDHLD